jgi:hypothetical protein
VVIFLKVIFSFHEEGMSVAPTARQKYDLVAFVELLATALYEGWTMPGTFPRFMAD